MKKNTKDSCASNTNTNPSMFRNSTNTITDIWSTSGTKESGLKPKYKAKSKLTTPMKNTSVVTTRASTAI